MKKIDINTWERKKSYLWFSSFSDPTYAVSAKVDITPLIALKKKAGRSFYEDMLYLTVKALNSVPAMRLRVVGNDVVEYEAPAPSYTVALEGGVFDVCRTDWNDDPDEFCPAVREGIETTIVSGGNKELGEEKYDVYYFTCLPWLNFETMTNPIPDDKGIQSIPRICWGQYRKVGEKYLLSISIQVSHALVDGKPLCDAFAAIQNNVNNCAKLLIK